MMEAEELVHPDRSYTPVVATHGGFVVWLREGVGNLLLVDVTHLKSIIILWEAIN